MRRKRLENGAKRQLVRVLRPRYRVGTRMEKAKILDELVAVTGFHRKHAIRLPADQEPAATVSSLVPVRGRKVYDEAVGEALVGLREAADRICGKRLKAILEPLIDAMERHSHLALAPALRAVKKKWLRTKRSRLDPVELLFKIRQAQEALSSLAAPEKPDRLGRESLESFLAALPYVWQEGEIRPTHRKRSSKPHDWRTRPDPFEGVWTEVLGRLQTEPDTTAKALFHRLQEKRPCRYWPGQLRTLQRRVKDWRAMMARELVYTCLQGEGVDEAQFIGVETP